MSRACLISLVDLAENFYIPEKIPLHFITTTGTGNMVRSQLPGKDRYFIKLLMGKGIQFPTPFIAFHRVFWLLFLAVLILSYWAGPCFVPSTKNESIKYFIKKV